MPFKSLGAVSYLPSIVTTAVSVAVVRYLASKSSVTLKTGLGFVQGHWKWHHLIDRIRVPIRHGDILLSFARYSDLLVENREICIPACI